MSGRPSRARLRAADQPKAAERILSSAGQLFADRGFKETSIQMLADAAGVNRALIFYYFQSKDALYRRLIEAACEAFAGEVGQAVRAEDCPVDRLRAWVRVTCRAMARHPDLLRLLLREIAGPRQAILPVGRYTDAVEGPLRDILEQGRASGRFRDHDPAMTAISLFGIMLAFFRRRYVTGQDFEAEVVADHILGLVLEGLLR